MTGICECKRFPGVRGCCAIAWTMLGLMLVTLFCGCGSTGEDQVRIRFAPIRPLTFGVFPFRESRALRSALEPLMTWLSRRLETPVQLRLVQDYFELERLVVRGDLDLAWCSPRMGSGLGQGSATASLIPLCRPIGRTAEGYHGLILARCDRGIASLTDLAGKSFAFVDRHSNSGFVFPNRLLAEAGLNPARDFTRLLFSGNHDRSLRALLEGSIDAIAVSEFVLRDPALRLRLGQDLRIIATTAAILPDPFLVSTNLPVELQQHVRSLFQNVASQPGGAELLASLSQTIDVVGFQPPGPETGANGEQRP